MSYPPLSAGERTALKARLTSCFETLSALPDTSHTRPQAFLSHWPDMKRSAKKGAILHRAVTRPRPSPEAISDCERLLDALYDLTPFQRQLLIARAAHLPWQALMARFGKSRTHITRLHLMALADLAGRLQARAKVKKAR